MDEFAHAASETRANLAQRVGAGEVAEKHGHELGPATKASGVALGAVFAGQTFELKARKMLAKQLTEEVGVA
jgi:hypothetical protein